MVRPRLFRRRHRPLGHQEHRDNNNERYYLNGVEDDDGNYNHNGQQQQQVVRKKWSFSNVLRCNNSHKDAASDRSQLVDECSINGKNHDDRFIGNSNNNTPTRFHPVPYNKSPIMMKKNKTILNNDYDKYEYQTAGLLGDYLHRSFDTATETNTSTSYNLHSSPSIPRSRDNSSVVSKTTKDTSSSHTRTHDSSSHHTRTHNDSSSHHTRTHHDSSSHTRTYHHYHDIDIASSISMEKLISKKSFNSYKEIMDIHNNDQTITPTSSPYGHERWTLDLDEDDEEKDFIFQKERRILFDDAVMTSTSSNVAVDHNSHNDTDNDGMEVLFNTSNNDDYINLRDYHQSRNHPITCNKITNLNHMSKKKIIISSNNNDDDTKFTFDDDTTSHSLHNNNLNDTQLNDAQVLSMGLKITNNEIQQHKKLVTKDNSSNNKKNYHHLELLLPAKRRMKPEERKQFDCNSTKIEWKKAKVCDLRIDNNEHHKQSILYQQAKICDLTINENKKSSWQQQQQRCRSNNTESSSQLSYSSTSKSQSDSQPPQVEDNIIDNGTKKNKTALDFLNATTTTTTISHNNNESRDVVNCTPTQLIEVMESTTVPRSNRVVLQSDSKSDALKEWMLEQDDIDFSHPLNECAILPLPNSIVTDHDMNYNITVDQQHQQQLSMNVDDDENIQTEKAPVPKTKIPPRKNLFSNQSQQQQKKRTSSHINNNANNNLLGISSIAYKNNLSSPKSKSSSSRYIRNNNMKYDTTTAGCSNNNNHNSNNMNGTIHQSSFVFTHGTTSSYNASINTKTNTPIQTTAFINRKSAFTGTDLLKAEVETFLESLEEGSRHHHHQHQYDATTTTTSRCDDHQTPDYIPRTPNSHDPLNERTDISTITGYSDKIRLSQEKLILAMRGTFDSADNEPNELERNKSTSEWLRSNRSSNVHQMVPNQDDMALTNCNQLNSSRVAQSLYPYIFDTNEQDDSPSQRFDSCDTRSHGNQSFGISTARTTSVYTTMEDDDDDDGYIFKTIFSGCEGINRLFGISNTNTNHHNAVDNVSVQSDEYTAVVPQSDLSDLCTGLTKMNVINEAFQAGTCMLFDNESYPNPKR